MLVLTLTVHLSDNDQLSNLDNLLVQLGRCSLLLPADLEERNHPDGRKLRELLSSRSVSAAAEENTVSGSVTLFYTKRSLFKRPAGEATALLSRLVGGDTHRTNTAEVKKWTCNHMYCTALHAPH